MKSPWICCWRDGACWVRRLSSRALLASCSTARASDGPKEPGPWKALEGPGRPWAPGRGGDSKAKEEIEAALGWKCEQFFNNLTWKGCPRLELRTKRFKSCIELEKRSIITKNWLSKWTEHRQISCERRLSYVKASKPSYWKTYFLDMLNIYIYNIILDIYIYINMCVI